MPIYKLRCAVCGDVFERLVFSTSQVVKCPCGGTTERMPTAAALSFKGRGFHVNDYPSVDRAVGTDSEKRWRGIHERRAVKDKLLKTVGEGETVVRDDAGKYGVTDKPLKPVSPVVG